MSQALPALRRCPSRTEERSMIFEQERVLSVLCIMAGWRDEGFHLGGDAYLLAKQQEHSQQPLPGKPSPAAKTSVLTRFNRPPPAAKLPATVTQPPATTPITSSRVDALHLAKTAASHARAAQVTSHTNTQHSQKCRSLFGVFPQAAP